MPLVKCPECGGEVSDVAEFCVHCGYILKQDQSDQVKFCPFCGKPNTLNSSYCGYCGKSFETSTTLKPSQVTGEEYTDISKYKDHLDGYDDPIKFRKIQLQLQKEQLKRQQEQYEAMAKCPRCGSVSLSANKRGKTLQPMVMSDNTYGFYWSDINSSEILVTCLNCGYKFKL